MGLDVTQHSEQAYTGAGFGGSVMGMGSHHSRRGRAGGGGPARPQHPLRGDLIRFGGAARGLAPPPFPVHRAKAGRETGVSRSRTTADGSGRTARGPHGRVNRRL